MINLEIQDILKQIETLDTALILYQKIVNNNPELALFTTDNFKIATNLVNTMKKDVQTLENNYYKSFKYVDNIKKIVLDCVLIENADTFENNKTRMLYKYNLYSKRFKNLTPEHQQIEYTKFIKFANLEHVNETKKTFELIRDRYCLMNLILEMEPSLTKLKTTFKRDHSTISYARDKHTENLKYYKDYAERYRVIGNLLLTYIFTEA